MHVTTMRKVGGSIMVAIPPALLDVLHLSAGAKVGLTVVDGRLLVEPQGKPRYSLDDLLAQCDPQAELDQTGDWLEAKPVGHEIL